MTYNENILNEARKIISEKKLNATIEMNGLSAFIIIDGIRRDFVTPKLAKICLQEYAIRDNIEIDRNASGIVSQNTDEAPKKRRGRLKKADNDRTSSI